MTGGLVQDYSKSPIKITEPERISLGNDAPHGKTASQPQTASPYVLQTAPNTFTRAADLSAPPPKRSLDIQRTTGTFPPRPMGQQHDPAVPIPQRTTAPYSSPYTQPANADVLSSGYVQPAQAPYIQNDMGGYRQNPMHDGGSTDYGNGEGESSLEYAERTWKSATQAVSEYTSTAGEVAGNALGTVKGWLNPESKGLR